MSAPAPHDPTAGNEAWTRIREVLDERGWLIAHGDCLSWMRFLPDCSIDAVVTDPPAGIGFMAKEWDDFGGRDRFVEWLAERLRECLRVLKPGGHALVWALPRTSHWTATAIEEAGFEIRDRVSHLFGSGFPKSLDVSKAIDKAAGAERAVVGVAGRSGSGRMAMNDAPGNGRAKDYLAGEYVATAPATDDARRFDGYGTALKPACEDWWLCRKPLEGTVAENVIEWGTGGLNIAGCRVTSTSQGAARSSPGGSTTGTTPWLAASQICHTASSEPAVWSGGAPAQLARHAASALSYALLQERSPDSLVDCPPCPRCGDGLARLSEVVARASSLRRVDAPVPLDLRWIASHIRESRCGDHPSIWDGLAQQVEEAFASGNGSANSVQVQAGRWPAHLVLSHTEGCTLLGTRQVKADGHYPAERGAGGVSTSGHGGQDGLEERYVDGEEVEVWDCAEDCPVRMLDEQSGAAGARAPVRGDEPSAAVEQGAVALNPRKRVPGQFHKDKGGASRFFYVSKASRSEREAGLEHLPKKSGAQAVNREEGSAGLQSPRAGAGRSAKAIANTHPTVKGLDLMRWLVRLVRPPTGAVRGGRPLILDPFAGSGSTVCAALLEGAQAIGIESDPESVPIARGRAEHWAKRARRRSACDEVEILRALVDEVEIG